MANADKQKQVLVPLKAEAFILNEHVCDNANYKIAPIERPHYERLQLEGNKAEADLIDHVDLEGARGKSNSRLYESGTLLEPRMGVYLHWVLPLYYRSGRGAVDEAATKEAEAKGRAGFPQRAGRAEDADQSIPEYRPVPNRWLVTRVIRPDYAYEPAEVDFPKFESWVIQSDALRHIGDPDVEVLDEEVDVSPFLDPSSVRMTQRGTVARGAIASQAETVVGKKLPYTQYSKTGSNNDPHVNLTAMASANPLLVDYQPHNANIFSTLDNFAYKDTTNKTCYLEAAEADYFILGWHSVADDDPMTRFGVSNAPNFAARLEELEMSLKGIDAESPPAGAIADWLNASNNDTRCVCHAELYRVKWNREATVDLNIEAQQIGAAQSESSMAVGTSSLDALVAYFEALADADGGMQDSAINLRYLASVLGQTGESDIQGLQRYADENYQMAFDNFDGGYDWTWKDDAEAAGAKNEPGSDALEQLRGLSTADQERLNALSEQRAAAKRLYDQWWTWSTSPSASSGLAATLKGIIEQLFKRALTALLDKIQHLEDQIADLETAQATKVPANAYYQAKDPTLLLTHLGTGWERDFSESVQVRFLSQALTQYPSSNPGNYTGGGAQAHLNQLLDLVAPTELQSAFKSAWMEFYGLGVPSFPWPDNKTRPFFHEGGRNKWNNTQPWRPLFIEWEAYYYHIPFDKWTPNEAAEQGNSYGAPSVLRYEVKEKVADLFDNGTPDVTRIAGRSILEPQSGSSFKAIVRQVFLNTNPDDLENVYGITADMQEHLLAMVDGMQLETIALTAITHNLTTTRDGSHLTPMLRTEGGGEVLVDDAVANFGDICPDGVDPRDALAMVGGQGEITPYATAVDLFPDVCPFKPVRHGQAQFTKINVVDRFGQAIELVDSSQSAGRNQFTTVSPVISDSLSVGEFNGKANGALEQPGSDACPFFALAPAIHQPARLNAAFVTKVFRRGAWRWQHCSEWDSPIWGWVVVNYADRGLQFFRGDGQFYRELRLNDAGDVSKGFKYLPFAPPELAVDQLDHLLNKLFSSSTYFEAFFDMVSSSIRTDSLSPTPATYASFSSAIVGRPMALVNAGWSLQLADPPKQNLAVDADTGEAVAPPRTLLKPDEELSWPDRQWEAAAAMPPGSTPSLDPARYGYSLPVKIGDEGRRYDGTIGYFRAVDGLLAATGSDLDLDRLYTFPGYITPGSVPANGDPRVAITATNLPLHTPYFLSTETEDETVHDHDDKLRVLGLIIDPFLPVHAFSDILPAKALRLPDQIVEKALRKMTAFWRVGPLVAPTDVNREFKREDALTETYVEDLLAAYAAVEAGEGVANIELPSVALPLTDPTGAAGGGAAKFVYLQPYRAPVTAGDGEGEMATFYNAYKIDARAVADDESALAPGPFTALEGYIQIAKPLALDL